MSRERKTVYFFHYVLFSSFPHLFSFWFLFSSSFLPLVCQKLLFAFSVRTTQDTCFLKQSCPGQTTLLTRALRCRYNRLANHEQSKSHGEKSSFNNGKLRLLTLYIMMKPDPNNRDEGLPYLVHGYLGEPLRSPGYICKNQNQMAWTLGVFFS